MSAIIGVVREGKVIMATDTQRTWGNVQTRAGAGYGSNVIWTENGVMLGVAGYQLIKYAIVPHPEWFDGLAHEPLTKRYLVERVIPPRPLSHDLMVSMFHAFGISLDEVLIYKFSEGVFMSKLKLSANDQNLELESRTSDAIALALRTNAPIYTTQEVLDKTGFLIKDGEQGKVAVKPKRTLSDMTVEELQKKLNRAVELEKYELAASIQKAINEKLGNEPKTEDLAE